MEVSNIFFVWLFLGINQYWAGWVYGFVVLCLAAPKGSRISSGSGLKCLRRLGHDLKSCPTDWENRLLSYGLSVKLSLWTQIIII